MTAQGQCERVARKGLRVVVAGGGSGGHLAPGVAVCESLREYFPDVQVTWVGAGRAVEKQLLQTAFEEHVEFVELAAEPLTLLQRHPLRFFRRTLSALRQANRLLKQVRPQVVVGLGGFACFAPALVARLQKIPLVLLEQNVVPGKTIRWLSRWADLVCTPCEQTVQWLPRQAQVLVTGNPVRRAVLEAAQQRAVSGEPEELKLLVVGGSQGARTLNQTVPLALKRLKRWSSNLQLHVVHQTGAADLEATKQQYEPLEINVTLTAFLNDLPEQLARSNLVVTRAGASTLAELACIGVPAIVVPFPFAAEQHQRANARWFERFSGVVVLEEPVHDSKYAERFERFVCDLARVLNVLLDDAESRRRMSLAQRQAASPEAASTVAQWVLHLCGLEPKPSVPRPHLQLSTSHRQPSFHSQSKANTSQADSTGSANSPPSTFRRPRFRSRFR